MAQDAHFLTAFSSAYQAALKKATHARDSDAKEVLETLLHGVSEELEMHASYAKVTSRIITFYTPRLVFKAHTWKT